MEAQEFSSLWLFVLIPLGFLILFPIFWLFVVWLIGAFGGWQQLAARYRTPLPATGKEWAGQYGFVGGARYGNALKVTTNEIGLFLEVVRIFDFNHPRLFIPWSDLHNPRPLAFRRRELVQVDVGHPPIATLRLPPAILGEGKILKGQSLY